MILLQMAQGWEIGTLKKKKSLLPACSFLCEGYQAWYSAGAHRYSPAN